MKRRARGLHARYEGLQLAATTQAGSTRDACGGVKRGESGAEGNVEDGVKVQTVAGFNQLQFLQQGMPNTNAFLTSQPSIAFSAAEVPEDFCRKSRR